MTNDILIVSSSASEIYSESDISKIKKILKNLDIKVGHLDFKEDSFEYLAKESPKLILNLIPVKGDKYSNLLPALCDLYEIPYTGSGIFTISSLSRGFAENLLAYHEIEYNPKYDTLEQKIEDDLPDSPKQNISIKRSVSSLEKSVFELYRISIVGNKNKLILNTLDIDGENKWKTVKLHKSELKKIIELAQKMKDALKIYDHIQFDVPKDSMNEAKLTVTGINPSPVLKENSNFYDALKSKGITYDEMIIAIIASAMVRYNILFSKSMKKAFILKFFEKFEISEV